ncbi:unnamed protein product [Symbiodinium sp. CCMP2592]|nr:unnamed protein product [Symbiodinium sp. CCMP2592]
MASMSESELRATASLRRRAALSKPNRATPEEISLLQEASNSEVTDNFIEGPYTEAQVTEIFGHSDWGIIPRFVLEQGLEKKIRPIDDGHASQVNEAFTSLIKLELQGADFVAGLALLISQAEKERSERLGVAARKWVGRTLDLSKAYKQLGVLPQHRDIAVICHPNEDGEPQFFIANALMFGLTSSVYGFVRVARSLHFLLAKVLKIPSANYFDDYPLFTLRDGAHELDGLTSEFLELLGWRFAQTGVKGQPYEEAFTVLGMQLDISRLHEGAAVLANKEGRVKRISEMLGSIFDKGALGRHEAQVLLGLLNYASGFFAGRSLKPACHFLLSLVRGKRQTAAEIKRFCKTTQAVLSTTPPRVLRIFDPRPPIHVWTDGAWEDPWAGIGAVVLDTLDDSARVFAGCVPAKLLERWKLDVGSQLICEIELYALVTLRRMLQNSLCNRRVIFWLDNEAARTSAIKGLSQSESMYRLAHYLAVIEAEAPCIAWYERVPSFSNIADPPSRGEGHSILSLVGAKVVEAFIHDESSNQRFLHQGFLKENHDSSVKAALRLFGVDWASDKDLPFSPTADVLGVRLDATDMEGGVLRVKNKPERSKEIASSIDKILADGCIDPKQIPSLFGRIQFSESQLMGRQGRLALAQIRWLSSARHRHVLSSLDATVFRSLRERMLEGRPREIQVLPIGGQTLVFTDGACDKLGDKFSCSIGGVMYRVLPTGFRETRAFGCYLDESVVEQWAGLGKRHLIGPTELFAVVAARHVWKDFLNDQRVVFYVDHSGVLSAMIKGSSRDDLWRSILLHYECADSMGPAISWFARVPSKSNPGDGPSRSDWRFPVFGEYFEDRIVCFISGRVLKVTGQRVQG